VPQRFIFPNHDFIDPALMPFFSGKFRAKPDIHNLKGQLFANDPRTQGHHVSVIVFPGHSCRDGIRQQCAPDAFNLICSDRYTDTGGTQDNTPVTISRGNRLSGSSGKIRVVTAVLGTGAEILHLIALALQSGNQSIFHLQRAVITADSNSHS